MTGKYKSNINTKLNRTITEHRYKRSIFKNQNICKVEKDEDNLNWGVLYFISYTHINHVIFILLNFCIAAILILNKL